MRPIEVKLGRSIPAELLGSNELFAKCQRKNVYYNCPGCFGPKKIELLSLHESGHILYTHALGIADITLSGPSIEYDQDEKRIFAADGSVAWVKGPAYPTPGIKSFIDRKS